MAALPLNPNGPAFEDAAGPRPDGHREALRSRYSRSGRLNVSLAARR
ncbi:hypothetical protein ABIA33_001324 [Streptacidiphilus sp. MAP12-16]